MIHAFVIRYANLLKIAGVVLACIALMLLASWLLGKDDAAEHQAEQTTASGNAIADAAQDAIATIGTQAADEQAINDAVDEATANIAKAPDTEAVRSAVIAGVCQQRAHKDDPACAKP